MFSQRSISLNITPWTPLKISWRFGGTLHLNLQRQRINQARSGRGALIATCFTLIYCLAYSSIMKIEATCSSETSLDFQRIHILRAGIAQSVYRLATDWTTRVSEFKCRWGQEFSLPHILHTDSGVHLASCQMTTGDYHLGVKRPECEADCSPQASAKVKKMWIYTCTPIRLHRVVFN
jgi:hypothetical protein